MKNWQKSWEPAPSPRTSRTLSSEKATVAVTTCALSMKGRGLALKRATRGLWSEVLTEGTLVRLSCTSLPLSAGIDRQRMRSV